MNLHIRWCRNQNHGFFFFFSIFLSTMMHICRSHWWKRHPGSYFLRLCLPSSVRCQQWHMKFMQWLRSWMSWLWVLDYPSVSRHTPHYGSEPCLTLGISNPGFFLLPLQYHWPRSQSDLSSFLRPPDRSQFPLTHDPIKYKPLHEITRIITRFL